MNYSHTFVVVATLAVLATLATAAAPSSVDRVVVEDALDALPEGWALVAEAHGSRRVTMHVALQQRNLDVLAAEVMAVSSPSSPRYGKHLSMEEVDALVAPHGVHVARVLGWLAAEGVDVDRDVRATGNMDLLAVEVDVATASRLLEAQFNVYRHASAGHEVVRAHGGYSVPSIVRDAIAFVGPTTRFPAVRPLRVRTVQAAGAANGKHDSPPNSVTPDVLRALYNIGNYKVQTTKSQVCVTGFLGQYISQADLTSFYQQYEPSLNGYQPLIVGPNDPTNPGVEASLDIQYATALGRGTNATFWSTAGAQPHAPSNEPFLDFLLALASTSNAPQVVSTSYGDNENSVWADYQARVGVEFQKAGARGITLLFSSGDGGVAGGQSSFCPNNRFIPTWPAGSPWVTAVGGTDGGSPTETAASFSSGGFSDREARPAWQVAAVKQYMAVAQGLPPAADFNQTGAGIPDIAAAGENFMVVQGGGVQGVDGTSCSSPTVGGIVALLNDARLAAGKSVLGYLNPLLYDPATAAAGAFNDIVSGSNPGCFTNGFSAAKGWDPVTGLGTINFANLKAYVLTLP